MKSTIIKVRGESFKVTKWKGRLYLEGKIDNSDWVEIEDLTEMRIWEYNELVDGLKEHYPDYPIEHLKGKFI